MNLAELENRLVELEKKQLELNETLSVASITSNSIHKKYNGYVTQSEFGNMLDVTMGSVTVGKLFKVIGLAQKNKDRTTPYRQCIPKYAKVFTKEVSCSAVWHYGNIIGYLNRWLKRNGMYKLFYSIKDETEMLRFVNSLYKNTQRNYSG